MNATRAYLPSVDGLRAVSILLVLWSHLSFATLPPYLHAKPLGRGGVCIFFVISGFLITSQLIREHEKRGTVRLTTFFIRRLFRLFPALLVFLATIEILAHFGVVMISASDLVHSLTYTMDYHQPAHPTLEHLWSLSIEEQFYLLWPLAILALTRTRLNALLLATIAVCPLLRILGAHQNVPLLFHRFEMLADTLAIGCLLSLRREPIKQLLRTSRLSSTSGICCCLGIFLFCCLLNRFYPLFDTVGISIEALCAASILGSIVFRPDTAAAKLLRWSPLVWLGQISYSLYLWQQVFLLAYYPDQRVQTGILSAPWNLIALFAAAVLSYYLVESPLRNFGRRLTAEHPKKGAFITGPRTMVALID